MTRLQSYDDQHVLFPDADLRGQPSTPAPLRPLPSQPQEEIDTKRVAKILGLTVDGVHDLLKRKLIKGVYRVGHIYRIPYAGVVDFCDELRLVHAIPPRKPLSKGFRPKDTDILPFPLAETINVAEVATHLDISERSVLNLLEEGAILGYKLVFGLRGSPWRIHRPSFDAYIDRLHEQAAAPSQRAKATSPASV